MFKRPIYHLSIALLTMATLATAAFAGVTVSLPAPGSTSGSPVHFVASASSTTTIASMRIYVDGVSQYLVYSNKLDTNIALANGTHSVIVKAWDNNGTVLQNAFSISVSGTSGGGGTPPPAPAGSKVFTKIEEMPAWDNCDKCAGQNANGPIAPHSMTTVTSTTMDGKSAQFWLGGSTPYSSALWWKQLGANSAVSHFTYDLYFYLKDTKAAFAVEFDVNQSTGGRRYVMGTQCGVQYDKQWDVWDTANKHWVKTGIPCTNVQAYAWNHLTEEYYRANGRIYYVSITLNGQKYYVNRNFGSIANGANDINNAFQMDTNGSATPFTTWLDQVKLTYW